MSDSLCTHFQRRVARNGHQPAVRNADGTVAYTWAQYGAQVRELAAGLVALGVRSGDTVGIMLTNRPEFHLVDAAVMHLGAVGFSIYNTSSVNQIAYLLGNAAPRVLVTESQFLERIREATTDRAISTVCVDATEPDTIGLDEMIASADPGFDFDAAWQSIGRDDVLTLIYTSGTTGNPKGVELTHGNLLYQLGVVEEIIGDLTAG